MPFLDVIVWRGVKRACTERTARGEVSNITSTESIIKKQTPSLFRERGLKVYG
jgi:hypothetical protein